MPTYAIHPRASVCYGMLLLASISLLCLLFNQQVPAISPLMLAMLVGLVLGHSRFAAGLVHVDASLQWAKGPLLRIAIGLYGFRIGFEQIQQVGMQGVLMAVLVIFSVISCALWLGKKLGLDRHTSLLVGAGSAICGAAAVLASQSVLKASEEKVSVAIATVVLFGTLSMLLYPLGYSLLALPAQQYGVLIGATVHEVAQVAAASAAVSEQVQQAAIIEKMLRVMLLAPFLVWLGWQQSNTPGRSEKSLHLPWFALGFLCCSAIRTLDWLPISGLHMLQVLDDLMLTMAMLALGLNTRAAQVVRAGRRPLLLAAALFLLLLIGGYLLSQLLALLSA
ncbi:YeiH family protein [Bowmanella denitrificans]|uniref:YeiH family protein n=1 Tax=Bowmanella denitrificans TaxID=366582 RepID=UPI000C9D13BC|nr:putative sulfate exporter family transporter [Bowmanella denitrificans]